MRIIYLSQNMSAYEVAFYQNDVMEELERQHDVFFYGPGFPNYSSKDDISEVLKKAPFGVPDIVCVGHAGSVFDNPEVPNSVMPAITLSKLDIPKVAILNKEYTNLERKLEYIKEERIDLVFTHHHEIDLYEKKTEVNFEYWPFAMNHELFYDYKLPKLYDLTFTGLLRNPHYPETQTDVRIKVQNKLFRTVGEFRFSKKRKYRKYRIFWQARPTNSLVARVSRVAHQEVFLPFADYAKHLNKSRVCLNALSPANLISPRYYESMATKCLAYCQESKLYDGLFEEGVHYISFKEDLSDYNDKLLYYFENEDERSKIVERAYTHVRENHTWEKRISRFTDVVNHQFFS
jgi:spore maturation protein CgeB